MPAFICIHGHFYQPPRENPWLEQVETQPSAEPYHDWNQRITRECYAPNAAARLLDESGSIRQIVSNYARISFNFGPTLLSWFAAERPELLDELREADLLSRRRFSGHGSALAQAYNHMILPLANARDRETQIAWGLEAFHHYFGRPAEGMWLPETAVDTPTLEALAAAGVRFTILAPHQAGRVRPLAGGEWEDVSGARIDTRRAYQALLPSGRSLALFFYDGPASRAIAFEGLLADGGAFARRLVDLAGPEDGQPRLAHVATDGESYGHHHAHGDMALAYCLDQLDTAAAADAQAPQLTNYAEFLARFPPRDAVEFIENSSWSCAHGVERWRSDCGCNSGGQPGWHQRWRGPLRASLDGLRDALAPRFEARAQKLFRDPWQARNAYVQLVLDRSSQRVREFFARHAHPLPSASTDPQVAARDDETISEGLQLLELQRQAMLMYTSCGWFFDDISGIETAQVLAYAARAVELASRLFPGAWRELLLHPLESAPGNAGLYPDGRQVYEKLVEPSRVPASSLAVWFGVTILLNHAMTPGEHACYRLRGRHARLWRAGDTRLALGEVEVRSRITWESACFHYGLLHRGAHNFSGGVLPASAALPDASEIEQAFNSGNLAAVSSRLQTWSGWSENSLHLLFREAQHEVLERVLAQELDHTDRVYRQLYEHHVPLLLFLHASHNPVPPGLRLAAEFSLYGALRQELGAHPLAPASLTALLREIERAGVNVDFPRLAPLLSHRLSEAAAAARRHARDRDRMRALREAAGFVRQFPVPVDTWQAENDLFALLQSAWPAAASQDDASAREWRAEAARAAEWLRLRLPED